MFAGLVVLERYHRELLNFLTRFVRDRDTAADLAQESFLRVLRAQHAGEAVLEPRALLYRTARNLAVDQHRRAQVRRHESLEELPHDAQPALPASHQPEEAYASAQYADAMLAVVDRLPPRCREAFVLNRFDGLSHQEVAERMGISRNMVAQHIVRALLECKACDDRFHGRSSVKAKAGSDADAG